MAIDLEKVQDSPHLLDMLLQMEDVLDSLDIYCFKNWFKGEIVEGPLIRRYWLDMTLKYLHDDMPDPRAGLRLLKHGISVSFVKAKEQGSPDHKSGKETTKDIWLVKLSMPRRLVSQVATSEMDFYDDEIEKEDVEAAKDSGMDNEESGHEDEDTPPSPNPDDTEDADNGDEEKA